jgi:hypothetical protein
MHHSLPEWSDRVHVYKANQGDDSIGRTLTRIQRLKLYEVLLELAGSMIAAILIVYKPRIKQKLGKCHLTKRVFFYITLIVQQ